LAAGHAGSVEHWFRGLATGFWHGRLCRFYSTQEAKTMGNRAVITTSTTKEGFGIYLHWNGGAESVVAFLDAAKERGYRDPAGDSSYAMARLCGLIHEFFGVDESTSLGIGTLESLDCDNFDNGVYVIGKDWSVIDRWGKGSSPLSEADVQAIRGDEKYQSIINALKLKEQVEA
jgi:hypothetical protein